MLSILIILTPICAAAEYYEVLIWGSTGFVMVLLLGFGLLWFRRRYHPDSMPGNEASSFSMRSIEEMRAGGMINDEEFRRLRASSLGLDAPKADKDNSILSTPADVDDGTEEPIADNEPQDYKESK